MNNWKKGCLHFHTIWSDGEALPEIAMHTWRDELKYDFVCLTEHNLFPDEELYLPVTPSYEAWPPGFSTEELKRSQAILGEKIVTRKIGIRDFVRLKSYHELRQEWEIPGKFLLIGGCENSACHLGKTYNEFHINILNTHLTVTPAEIANTPSETLRRNIKKCLAETAGEKRESLIMLNHPFWRYWDIDPRWVLENPEIRLLEICNNTQGFDPKLSDPVNSPEKFWDFILAHRILRGEAPLYATATDDSHHYKPENIHGPIGCNHGWVMVNCPVEFNEENIIAALKKGDFYASCGVEFSKIDFNRENRTLSVAVKAEAGVDYSIRFIVTKRDFNREIKELHYQGSKPLNDRDIPVIDESIGMCVKTIQGIEADYTLSDDDLYVRAEAVSDQPGELQDIFYPAVKKAWTQPFTR